MTTPTRHAVALVVVCAFGALATACADIDEQMRPEVALAPAPAACNAEPAPGRLCGCVYDLPLATRHVPEFATLAPLERLCVDRLAVTLRNGPPGFPGIGSRYEWFGVDFQGVLVVRTAGTYRFRVASDDGTKLVVDDTVVLNDDGLHDVRVVEGAIHLEAGAHRVRIPYWDGPGPMALVLEVAKPGQPYEALRFDQPL